MEIFCLPNDNFKEFTIEEPYSPSIPFFNREEGEKGFIEALKKNERVFYNNIQSSIHQKQEYTFLTVQGGAGTGKSRALRETKNTVIKAIQDGTLSPKYKRSIFIFVDYGNGFYLSNEEEKNGPSVALALRIFLTLFYDKAQPSSFIKEPEYMFLCKNNLLELNILFELMGRRIHQYFALNDKNFKLDDEIPIILLLDEFQKNREIFHGDYKRTDEDTTPIWRKPLHDIGSYSCSTLERNKNCERDHLIITTLIAGTLSQNEIYFPPTDYSNFYYPLPLFEFQTILKILEHCVEKKMIPKWIILPYYHRFWWLLGLLPRTLERSIDSLKINNYPYDKLKGNHSQILHDIYNSTLKNLTEYYVAKYQETEENQKILLLACSNMDLTSIAKDFIERQKKGGKIFINEKTRSVFIPHPVFVYFNENLSSPFKLLPHFENFDWKSFEVMDLNKIANSFSLLNDYLKEERCVTMRDLLRAGGNQKALSLKVDISDRPFLEESDPFVIKKKDLVEVKEEMIINESKVDMYDYVFKTKNGCYLIDGRFFFKRESKKYMVLIQYKLRLTFEEEKNYEKVKKESNDVMEWIEQVKKSLHGHFKEFNLVFLFVTTGQISEEMKKKIQSSYDYVLYVDRMNMEFYTTTNLYPYIMSPSNEEIELLGFLEQNKISKVETRYLINKEDLYRILDFLNVKRPKDPSKEDLFQLAYESVCKQKK